WLRRDVALPLPSVSVLLLHPLNSLHHLHALPSDLRLTSMPLLNLYISSCQNLSFFFSTLILIFYSLGDGGGTGGVFVGE
ncbi:unnamed protein product, partial [Brassica oleracea var. botrytis]